MKRGTLWIVFVALVVWSSAGCGSSSKKPLTVTISMAPTTLAVNSTGNVVATVTNDLANNGVIWNCTPAVACGAFSFLPSSTLSGATSVDQLLSNVQACRLKVDDETAARLAELVEPAETYWATRSRLAWN